MENVQINESLIVLVVGALVVVCVFLYSHARKLGFPSLVGFILLGLAVKAIDSYLHFLSQGIVEVLDVLGKIGIIALLFRVGLESDLRGLAAKIRSASVVWLVSVAGSGFLGFAATRWLLGAPVAASLFVGVAMTATSVGVSVGIWREAKALSSDTGELLVDVVELDDLSGVVLMSLLFGIATSLFAEGTGGLPGTSMALEIAVTLGKLAAFFLACYLFMRYVERPFTRYVERTESGPEPMLTMVGVSFVLASIAGLLGFSVAIGGFFAGLVFSQDREAVQMETSFEALYEFFVPFFFIFVGLSIPVSAVLDALVPGLVLLGAAVIGKLLFSWLPALLVTTPRPALLIGVSMIPRAEITMIILQHGRSFEGVAMPGNVYNGMILVVLVTVSLTPFVLRRLLARGT